MGALATWNDGFTLHQAALMTRPALAPALLTAAARLSSCGGGSRAPTPLPPPPPPAAPVVTTVDVTPPSAAPFMGDTLSLTATVKDQHGTVMAEKTVSWSSGNPALATVDATGRVIAVAPGSVTITAQVETKSGSAALTVVDPGPRVTLEPASATTRTIGTTGGTITATSVAGVTYDFVVPALALDRDVQITMTPITGFRKLPFSRGLVGGVEFRPSGIAFGPGARLVIRAPAPIPPLAATERLVGFTFEDGGESLRVQPVTAEGGGFAVAIEHFSGGGLAVGNTSNLATLPLAPGGSIQQQRSAQLAGLVLPQDLNAAAAVFQAWRTQIEPLIGLAQTGVEAKIATDLFLQWEMALRSFITGFGASGTALTAALATDQTALVLATQLAIKRGIAALNQQCLQIRSLLDANNVLYLRGYAEALSSFLTGIGSGLTLTAQLATLCIQPIQSFSRFPNPFPPSSFAPLDLTYGVKFGTDPVLDGAFFDVTVTVTGAANNGVATTRTSGGGTLQPASQIATGTTPITIQVKSCLSPTQVIPSLLTFLADVCHFSTITANPEPPLTILTASLPAGTAGSAYSQTLQANGGLGGFQWTVTSGSLPPGLSLVATGTISGTPSSPGSAPFTVRVSSGSQSQQRSYVITINGSGPPPPPPPPSCSSSFRIDSDARFAAASGITCANSMLIGGFNNSLTVLVSFPQLTQIVAALRVTAEVPGGLSLPALSSTGAALFEMAKLVTLDLPALTGSAKDDVLIRGAADLTTIRFGALQTLLGLGIVNNPKLTDISGIRCGARINGDLVITDNPQLSTAAAQTLANCLTISGTVRIARNKLP